MTSRLTSEALMPSVPIVMPSEIDTVLNSIGVPPARADAVFDVHGQIAQVKVAGTDFDPGVGDADERLLEVRVGEADGLQHRARRRAARAGGERVAHDMTSNGSGSQPSCVFQLAYEPSVRSIGANSARCASARLHVTSSRAAARST